MSELEAALDAHLKAQRALAAAMKKKYLAGETTYGEWRYEAGVLEGLRWARTLVDREVAP